MNYLEQAIDALKGGSNDYAQAYAMVSIAQDLKTLVKVLTPVNHVHTNIHNVSVVNTEGELVRTDGKCVCGKVSLIGNCVEIDGIMHIADGPCFYCDTYGNPRVGVDGLEKELDSESAIAFKKKMGPLYNAIEDAQVTRDRLTETMRHPLDMD